MTKEDLLNKFLCSELTNEEENVFLQYLEQDEYYAMTVKLESLFQAERSIKLEKYLEDTGKTSELNNSRIPHENRDSFKNKLITTEDRKASIPSILWTVLRNSAAILILGCITYFSYDFLSNRDKMSLLERYYNERYPISGLTMSENQNADIWEQAKIFYSNDKFEKAELEIAKIDNLTIQQKFFLGLSCMYKTSPDFDKSIEIFNSIIDHPDNLEKDATQWYLAIAYLKNNQKENARPIIEYISNNYHFKQKQAIQTLNNFEDF